jgi:hypothetical protein
MLFDFDTRELLLTAEPEHFARSASGAIGGLHGRDQAWLGRFSALLTGWFRYHVTPESSRTW